MKAVLKNDMYITRYLLLILLLISALSSWLNSISPDESFFSIASPLIYAAFLPPTLYMIDERSKWGRFSAALPGKRCDYIHSKYIIVIVSISIVMIITTIFIFLIFATNDNSYSEKMPVLVLGFSASLIMCSVLQTVTASFDSKAGIVAFFVMITLCGVAVGYCDAMIENGDATVPNLKQSILFLIVSILIYVLSWHISLLIYKHKEF